MTKINAYKVSRGKSELMNEFIIEKLDLVTQKSVFKKIHEISETEAKKYELLGAAGALNLSMAASLAGTHVPDFFEKVIAFRIIEKTPLAEMLNQVCKTSTYSSVEFYACFSANKGL